MYENLDEAKYRIVALAYHTYRIKFGIFIKLFPLGMIKDSNQKI